MQRKIVRDYENHMLFIGEMKKELNHLTYLLECSSTPFFKHSTIQKEQETISKIIALAVIKLDEIISPVRLTDLDRILNSVPTSKNKSDSK